MKRSKGQAGERESQKVRTSFSRVLVFGQLNHLALPLTWLSFFIFHFSFWRVEK
jgi:hypothetical protein